MEPESSLPHSQVPAACPCLEPDRSSPYPPHPTSWRSILILSSLLCLGLSSGLFHSGFPSKTLYTSLLSPIRTTFPAHHIIFYFIIRTVLGEQYRGNYQSQNVTWCSQHYKNHNLQHYYCKMTVLSFLLSYKKLQCAFQRLLTPLFFKFADRMVR
jgi:hypothetical protein